MNSKLNLAKIVLASCFIVINLLVPTLYAKTAPDSLKTFYLPTIRVIIGKTSEAIGSVTQLETGNLTQVATISEAYNAHPVSVLRLAVRMKATFA